MKSLTKNKYWDLIEDYNIDKLLYLLIDRPDKIGAYNEFRWINRKNQLHRNYDLPELIFISGTICWYFINYIHRKNNKPAKIWHDGHKEYWISGKRIR